MEILYYTVSEAAELLRTSPNTIRVKIREGKIPIHPWEGELRIPADFIENWDIEQDKETFRERRLRLKNEQLLREVQDLKKIIRSIVRIGMEIDL